MSGLKLQDPADSLTWQHDWSDFLDSAASPAEAISSRLWTIDPDDSPSLLTNTAAAAATAAGLARGVVYRLTETVTTSFGNVAARSIVLRCDKA